MGNPKGSAEEILQQARLLPSDEAKRAYLCEACGSPESELFRDLSSQLGLGEPADSGGDDATHSLRQNPAASLEDTAPLAERDDLMKTRPTAMRGIRAGALIAGRYRLMEQVGEGGMGSVWLAEQTEPVKRRVALKLIKPGMDSQQVLLRFEAERQALAMMDHASIAKVLDGGLTDQERPFFVMEFVNGLPLTQFCDENQLSLAERLRLIVEICHAVQHAHQKGVMHRDLKPSNILVSQTEDGPLAKVIDFGLAKAMDEGLTDHSMFTVQGAVVGTPLYMSPEQASPDHLDVDTRTDVYSLGVVLYELLTSEPPLSRKRLQEASINEKLRLISEEEALLPSHKVKSVEAQAEAAASRGLAPDAWARQLSGDLDWITAKAVEKDRERRYETAVGLADDIQRFLCDMPVEASPPSTAYRVKKFVKRNRVAVTGAAIALCCLLLGAVGTTAGMLWAFQEQQRANRQAYLAGQAAESETRQREIAEKNEDRAVKAEAAARKDEARARLEAEKANSIASLLSEALQGVGPSVALGRDTELLKEVLDVTVKRIEIELQDAPEIEAPLRMIIGATYQEIGEYALADFHGRRALELYSRMQIGDAPEVARQLNYLGSTFEAQDRAEEAESHYRKSLAMSTRLDAGSDDNEEAEAMRNLATLLTFSDRTEEARKLLDRALELSTAFYGEEEHVDVATIINAIGNLERWEGNNQDAQARYEQALAIHRRMLPPEHHFISTDVRNLAALLIEEREYDEAERLLLDNLKIQRDVLGDHPDVAHSLAVYSRLLSRQGRFQDSEKAIREALGLARRYLPQDHSATRQYLNALGGVVGALGRNEESLQICQELLAMDIRTSGEYSRESVISHNNFAHSLMDVGRLLEAEKTFRKGADIAEKLWPDGSRERAMMLNNLGHCVRKQGRFQEALGIYRSVLQLRRKLLGDKHEDIANTLSSMGSVYVELEEYPRAEQMKREALAMYAELLGEDHLYAQLVKASLANVLRLEGRHDEAEAMFAAALPAIRESFGETGKRTLRLRARLARVWAVRGEVAKAEQEFVRILAVGEQGLERKLKLATLTWTADLYLSQMSFEKAEPILLKVVALIGDEPSAKSVEGLDPVAMLVRLYREWNETTPNAQRADEAAKWQAKLDARPKKNAEDSPEPNK